LSFEILVFTDGYSIFSAEGLLGSNLALKTTTEPLILLVFFIYSSVEERPLE